MGFYPFDLQGVVLQLAVVSLAATLVESLPITNRFDDNLTVPLTTVILGLFLFPTRSIAGVLP
jgi:dolichol kinase